MKAIELNVSRLAADVRSLQRKVTHLEVFTQQISTKVYAIVELFNDLDQALNNCMSINIVTEVNPDKFDDAD